jgi:hypothetical protein
MSISQKEEIKQLQDAVEWATLASSTWCTHLSNLTPEMRMAPKQTTIRYLQAALSDLQRGMSAQNKEAADGQ